MKKLLLATCYLLLATLTLTGCAKLKQITAPIKKAANTVGAVLLPPYIGPKAKITVAEFENKTPKANAEINSALRRDLINSLTNSNRFVVSEPNAKTPDLILAVSLAEFDPRVSGGKSGIGGGGGTGNDTFGGLFETSLNKAHVVLEISLISASTQKLLAINRIEGQASDISAGSKDLSGVLSVYNNTPMAKAIRLCISESVRYITQAVPIGYYQY